ncbi:hypothetical protein H4R33_006598 [Dimargaris cristalligena]|uniref:Uncharacterized protein n=1 Tax=Dimargaris cristalligena TaxID=215637 RepID=A0A4V1J455_9FUNG|nr:hypothetical protein H4R33_006598 [Dimargaris cristalligena]RKP34379.1 hypothetical protein BJ085DRAFT_31844 [Dimargaris cristalligena]|eukprot:RKP34379.1 hypothetical protein BJ085DRAFT_31844 [Dimargaris cristalligena]
MPPLASRPRSPIYTRIARNQPYLFSERLGPALLSTSTIPSSADFTDWGGNGSVNKGPYWPPSPSSLGAASSELSLWPPGPYRTQSKDAYIGTILLEKDDAGLFRSSNPTAASLLSDSAREPKAPPPPPSPNAEWQSQPPKPRVQPAKWLFRRVKKIFRRLTKT